MEYGSIEEDVREYAAPGEISIHLVYKEVNLGHFKENQQAIMEMMSGDELCVEGMECLNKQGVLMLEPSGRFIKNIRNNFGDYRLKTASVNLILFWKGQHEKEEISIILPEFCFERREDTC
ncbi:hypothetical protein [Chitinophaga rhizophila]|uniref:Uncharacterized protein n=1 Tax=Chitinophaga rhizophila TaxID=2866212 RepID=A0ABS7G7C4_9BACT|nr:hypothetical protein [Chitinophaga rhizophila]MBW8683562.1 hypothetical protein [Chitinophaga rhizophila]